MPAARKSADRTGREIGRKRAPAALVFEEAGFPVLGFDVDPKKPEALHRGDDCQNRCGAGHDEGRRGGDVRPPAERRPERPDAKGNCEEAPGDDRKR